MAQVGSPSARSAHEVFVGREQEMAELRAGLEAARQGRGALFTIAGEPGIGKSRLAAQFSAVARTDGALVLHGQGWEGGGAPAFWPWIQVLRAYLRAVPQAPLGVTGGSVTVDLVQLVPELRERLGSIPGAAPASAQDPERARFLLFDAVTTFLEDGAAERPLVIVLDDLHAADQPSLLLLRFLARAVGEASILVVGAHRDRGAPRQPETIELLGEIARDAHRLALGGLRAGDVRRLIADTYGIEATPALVAAVHRATAGNPFFVDGVIRALAAEGRLETEDAGVGRLPIPEGVRDAARRRLAALGPECRDVLAAAAVMGREFDVKCIARAIGLPADRVLEYVGEAAEARIVSECASGPEHYAFTHMLLGETLYDDLLPLARMRLHQGIAEALEGTYGTDPAAHVAALAHHFSAAVPAGDARKAVNYCTRAAQRALRLRAYEEAGAHYERALRALGVLTGRVATATRSASS